MATVGNLFINVKARTASFNKKMQSAAMRVKVFGAGIVRVGQRLAMFGMIAGTLAVAALVALTRSAMKSVDEVTKLARSIGASTESMVGLQHAAAISGLSLKEINKSIVQVVRRVGEASMGTSEATDALDALGLSAADLVNDQPDVLFGKIADAIIRIPSAAQRASIAYDLFGRSGVKLLNTMGDGSQGIREMIEEAKALGITFDELSGRKVEEANDAMHRMKSTIGGLGNQLAIEFAPMIVAASTKIKEFIISLGGMQPVAEFIAKGVMYAGAAILDVFKAIDIGWNGLRAGLLEGAAGVVRAMAWTAQKVAEAWSAAVASAETGLGLLAKAHGWALSNAGDVAGFVGLESVEGVLSGAAAVADTVGEGLMGQGRERFGADIESEIADFLGYMADDLSDQAADSAGAILDSLTEGWNVDKVDSRFSELREQLEAAISGQGAPITVPLELGDVDKGSIGKSLVQSVQTVLGSVKVAGADSQVRLLRDSLNTEKRSEKHLASIRDAVQSGGGVLA